MKIKCAAIQAKSGQVFEGKSHAAIFISQPKGLLKGAEQGFVTENGEFVDRYEAAEIAFKAGQTKKLESPLFSEDLTGDWPWQKKKVKKALETK